MTGFFAGFFAVTLRTGFFFTGGLMTGATPEIASTSPAAVVMPVVAAAEADVAPPAVVELGVAPADAPAVDAAVDVAPAVVEADEPGVVDADAEAPPEPDVAPVPDAVIAPDAMVAPGPAAVVAPEPDAAPARVDGVTPSFADGATALDELALLVSAAEELEFPARSADTTRNAATPLATTPSPTTTHFHERFCFTTGSGDGVKSCVPTTTPPHKLMSFFGLFFVGGMGRLDGTTS